MKRFYKSVGVQQAGGNFAVTLDGRTVKTPGGAVMVVKSPRLADAIAAEWARQEGEIDLDCLHLTRPAYAAGDSDGAAIAEKALNFARSDAAFYRAHEPAELVGGQEAACDG